jgi:uncharacterized membrane protein YbaN (DUF454 family)
VKLIELTLGGLFLGLAILGAFLPLLPTTPFLLLASFFFVRSSPRMADWLERSPLFGPLLSDWRQQRGVRLHVKLTAVGAIAAVVGWSLYDDRLQPGLKWLLCVLAGIGLFVVLRLKTVRGA